MLLPNNSTAFLLKKTTSDPLLSPYRLGALSLRSRKASLTAFETSLANARGSSLPNGRGRPLTVFEARFSVCGLRTDVASHHSPLLGHPLPSVEASSLTAFEGT